MTLDSDFHATLKGILLMRAPAVFRALPAGCFRRGALLLGVATLLLPTAAPQKQASARELLQHALYLADLYNWTDAGPDFIAAEKMFAAAGDERNALYARIGKIRATVEQRGLTDVSAQLEAELHTNPLLRADK